MGLPVFQREEGEVTVDALGLAGLGPAVIDHLALPGLDVPGEVGEVEPPGPAVLTDIVSLLGLTLRGGHMAGVVDLVGPVLATPPALEGCRLVSLPAVGLPHVLLDAGPHPGGELTARGLAMEQSAVILVKTGLALNEMVGS